MRLCSAEKVVGHPKSREPSFISLVQKLIFPDRSLEEVGTRGNWLPPEHSPCSGRFSSAFNILGFFLQIGLKFYV